MAGNSNYRRPAKNGGCRKQIHQRCNENGDSISRFRSNLVHDVDSVRQSIYKTSRFKANNVKNNRYQRKSWDIKTDLVHKQLDYQLPHQNELSSNYYRRSFPESSHGYYDHNKIKNLRRTLTVQESISGWYSILIPYIDVDDCDEILKKIEVLISPILLKPYNKHYVNNELRFLVDDLKIARILNKIGFQITLKDDRKLNIKVFGYFPRRQIISYTPVSNEIKEKMIQVMSTRYNPITKSLDLSRFHASLFFTENQLFAPLNQPRVLLAALHLVSQFLKHELYSLSLEKNHIYMSEGLVWIRRLFPELKVLDLANNKLQNLNILKSLSGYTIEVLNLSGNPVCCNAENTLFYRQNVQQLFPALKKLDNLELPSHYNPIIGTQLKIPINLSNSYPISENNNPEDTNPVVSITDAFLTQYYELFDNNTSKLMIKEAYQEDATLTLSCCALSKFSKGSLAQYLPQSQNFLNSTNKKNCSLFKGKKEIINVLEKLPKTKHDLGSFFIDVPFANSAMIQIVVNGVFAEDYKENSVRPVFRSFCRLFCIVPFKSGWRIQSDMLFVTLISEELLVESSKRFHVSNNKPLSSINNAIINENKTTMFVETVDEKPVNNEEAASLLEQQPSIETNSSLLYQQCVPTSNQESSTYLSPCQDLISLSSAPVSLNQQLLTDVSMNCTQSADHNLDESLTVIEKCSADLKNLNSSPMLMNKKLLSSLSDNSVNHVDLNPDKKLTMIKKFSQESGMNKEWTKKCLAENGWNYAKAAWCFSKLKPKIPSIAFK